MEIPRSEETRLPIRNVDSRPAREAQAAASMSPRPRAPRTSRYRATVEHCPEENGYIQPSYYHSKSSTHTRSGYAATEAPSERKSPRPRRREYRNSRSRAEDPGKRATFEPSSDGDEDMTPRRRSHRGHSFHDIINQGHARTHLGDMYIENQTVYNSWEQASSERNDDKRIDILEALVFDHMDTRLLSIGAAYGQTCRWLFSTDEYIGWRRSLRTGSHRRFLWIKGKPGAGKSTMMKLAFEQASEHFPRSIVASFFFSARGYGAAKTIEGMYRSLLHQILTKLPRKPSRLPTHIVKGVIRDGWPLSILQNLLQEALLALPKGDTVIFYVDALDECDEDDIRLALKHFEDLMAHSFLRNIDFLVCFASRHYPNISVRHHRPMNIDCQAAHSDDIFRYVENALKADGRLGCHLRDSISHRCAGIFPWAVLTVRILNKSYDEGSTRSQLWDRLYEVPTSIQALFSDILRELDEYLLPTLQWVLFSQRALKSEELYFAIMTSVGKVSTGSWDRDEINIARMRSFVLQSSRGLIEFRGEFAQFIHESVRDYLLGGGLLQLDPTLQDQVTSISHARLAQWCQTYVALDTAYHCEQQDEPYKTILYGRQFELRADFIPSFHRLPFLYYTLSATSHHMQIALDKEVLPLATLGRFADLWLTLALHRYSGDSHYECATLLCLLLAQCSSRLQPMALGRSASLKDTFSDARHISLHTDTHGHTVMRKPSSVLQNAAKYASIDIARFFRDRTHVKNFQTAVEGALYISASLGLNNVMNMLLQYTEWTKRTAVTNALGPAIVGLQESTTRELLRLGADSNGCLKAFRLGDFFRTLSSSITLLDLLAILGDPPDCDGNADEARIGIATQLLDSHATFEHALMKACYHNRPELAMLLISKGAHANRQSKRDNLATLQIARKKGYDEMSCTLIESLAAEYTEDSASSADSVLTQVG